MNAVVTVMMVLLSVFFLLAGSIKLIGWQKMIFEKQFEFFHSYGLNRQIMALVGVVELFGATAIWLHGTLGLLGAIALLGISIGALSFHLRFDTWKDGIPATVTSIFSGTVIYFG